MHFGLCYRLRMMELDEQKRTLEDRGIVKLERLVPKAQVTMARDLICDVAEKHGLFSAGSWRRSASRFSDAKPFRAAINALNHADHFPDLIGEDVMQIARDLQGEAVAPLPPGQQILFTLPSTVSWSVPNDVWHIDIPRLGKLGAPGLQVFIFLDDVEPKGGGTLALSGSHLLLNGSRIMRSKELKRALGKEPYFQELFDRERAPINRLEETVGSVDRVNLEVVELTGASGDVYFMDLRTLHTPAPNSSNIARLMITCRLPRAAIASVCLNPPEA